MAEDLIAILRAIEVADIDSRVKNIVRLAVELQLNEASPQAFLTLLEKSLEDAKVDN